MSDWTINSYRERAWNFTVLPEVGDRVFYMGEGFFTSVKCVHWDHVCFTDSTVLRRRFDYVKVCEWVYGKMMKMRQKRRESFVPVSPFIMEVYR